MKKLLIFLFIVFVLGAVALFVFVATFDANQYRSLVERRLESAIGNPVEIEHLALGWFGGRVALEMRELEIYASPDKTGEPALTNLT